MKNTNNYENSVGKTFGSLLVESCVLAGRGASFKVKCLPCGERFEIRAARVLNGSNKSCGCQRPIVAAKACRAKRLNLEGKKFGHLTVLRIDEEKSKTGGSGYWVCQCDCGTDKVKSISGHHLTKGNTISCGHVKIGKTNAKWQGHEKISGKFFYCIKKNAQSRKIPFDVTIEEIWDLFIKQDKRCALSGLPLSFPSIVGATDGTASLDRIDSNIGYSKNNCQWLHKDVNNMKWDFTTEEFVNYCGLIANFQNKNPQEMNLGGVEQTS